MEITAVERKSILDLARATIYRALDREPKPSPTESGVIQSRFDAPVFTRPAGCFVTLHQLNTHKLRGCVGRLDATEPLGNGLRSAAVSVLEDPRFADNPVRIEELAELEVEVSLLSPLSPARGPMDFDLLNDGVYLTYGNRSGCFLPQVARETGWSREQLLDRLCTEKMGLPTTAWRDPRARLSRFSTVTVGPEPFVSDGSINYRDFRSGNY